MQIFNHLARWGRPMCGAAIIPFFFGLTSAAFASDLDASKALCDATVSTFNTQFTTLKPLDAMDNIPVDSGLIVHTIHGPGDGTTELNMDALNLLTPDLSKTCGDFMMGKGTPDDKEIFLPWCGSNRNALTKALSDASSWTYLRSDALNNPSANQPVNNVVCEANDNKRYGLIFNNAYMNKSDNLGCMYPLDGDTGNRTERGCGVTQNPDVPISEGQGTCPTSEDPSAYIQEFDRLLALRDSRGSLASYAGSLTCALPRSKFDVWVDVRKQINLSKTTWPVNEFVLWNWDTYSTADLVRENVIIGVYYLSDCARVEFDGSRQEAQAIADLYKDWTTVKLPVVNLSNAALNAKSATPFSCQ